MNICRYIAGVGLALSLATANAAPIDIDEDSLGLVGDDFSSNPFLPDDLSPLVLDAGLNLISGRIDSSADDSLDGFTISVLAGNVIDEIRIIIANMVGDSGGASYDGSLTQATTFTTDGTYTLADVASLPFDGFYVNNASNLGIEFDYTWEIEVSGDSTGVPAPAGIALLGLGLMAIGRLRRRN